MLDGDRLVVVGNGMVGWQLCRQLVERGLHRERRIVVYGKEQRPAYDRIRLSECLNGTMPDALTLGIPEWYAEHGIELILNTEVTAINSERNCILVNGSERNYSHLVLATGSRPFIPSIPGVDLPGVYTYRTMDDVLRIRAVVYPGSRVVIVGGGLLGLELAKGLADHGVCVVILERSPGVMIRQLNPVASGIVHEEIERLGIEVAVAVQVESITKNDDGLTVTLVGGVQHEAELVIIAAGIRSCDELARTAGLTCSVSGGVIVDRFLRTSSPHISAIGECVSFGSTVYGLAAPGFHMAEILARRLAGERRAEFDGYDLGTRLKLAGLDVCTMGDYLADGVTATWRHGHDYRQIVLRDGRLVGATVIGKWDQHIQIADAVARRLPIDERRRINFSRQGDLLPRQSSAAAGVIGWPAQAIVCSCMRITRGVLGEALRGGCHSVAGLSTATRAGTVCGSCRPLLAVLVGADPAEQPVPKGGSLLTVSSALILIYVAVVLSWNIPRSSSYLEFTWFDYLWRDGFAKQVSGWTMVSLMVLSCLYVLRKRLAVLRWGDLGKWRACHAVVALMAGLGLIAHTGFRFGHNLDRWLACGFALVLVLGGVAGLMVAGERHYDSRFIRLARVWSLRCHLAAVSALVPVLLFHVLKVYRW